MLSRLADDEQLALERVLVGGRLAAPDEHLAHHRLKCFDTLTQRAVVDRDIAPTDDGLTFCDDLISDDLFTSSARDWISRQEQHAYAVISCRR